MRYRAPFLHFWIALADIAEDKKVKNDEDYKCVIDAFQIGRDRLFDDDPRFGLVVLSEIAARALSPAVNDHGTVIDVIGTIVRLFAKWQEPAQVCDNSSRACSRRESPHFARIFRSGERRNKIHTE